MKALLPEVQGRAEGKVVCELVKAKLVREVTGARAAAAPRAPRAHRRTRRSRRWCLIPDAVIDEIRDRVDVVAVIGRHMELKRSGRTWKGCCPFHGERTPSFHVYPEDKHFKCYGCGAYGDVFGFLQKLEGKEFPEVVRELAREVGVEIPEVEEESAEQQRRRQERERDPRRQRRGRPVLGGAAREPVRRLGADLPRGPRGSPEESVQRFRLGVAADEWNDLPRRLAEKGIEAPALERAGLVIEKEKGGVYDRFRDRLMFPIAAMDGQIIGFGGRALPARTKGREVHQHARDARSTRSRRCSTASTSRARRSAGRGRRSSSRGTST